MSLLTLLAGAGAGGGAGPTLPIPVGVPEWPLSLGLYESPGGVKLADWTGEVESAVMRFGEHGFDSLPIFVPMDLYDAFRFYDLAPAKFLLLSAGGIPVWEGRVEDRSIVDGGLEVGAFGYWRAFLDRPTTVLYSTKSYQGWKNAGSEISTSWVPERFYMDTNNRLFIGLLNGKTYDAAGASNGVYVFKHPHNASTNILEVTFSYDIFLDTDYRVRLLGWDESFSGAAEWTLNGNGAQQTGTATVTMTAARQLIGFNLNRQSGAGAFTGADNSRYAKITNVTIKGTTSSSIYADEIVKAQVTGLSAYNPGQISSSTAEVQNPGLDLDEAIWLDTIIGDILTDLSARGDNQTPPRRWEVGVFEKQRLYFRPRGSNILDWYTDVVSFELNSTLDEMENQQYGIYKDAIGRTLRTSVATDAISYSKYGVYRRGSVRVDTTSSTTAGAARDVVLEQKKDMTPKAKLVLGGLFNAAGAEFPLWMLRPGDTLTMRNLPPNVSTEVEKIRRFRVIRSELDLIKGVLKPTPEADLPNLEIQLGKLLGDS